MEYYRERKVLHQITARLVPPDTTLPDCLCELLLTADFFYVLEDDFDGEYTCHFEIPLKKLCGMEKYIEIPTDSNQNKSNGTGAGKYLAAALLGVAAGFVVLPGKNIRKKSRQEFLKITYKDDAGEDIQIYFNDLRSDMHGMIKSFQKLYGM